MATRVENVNIEILRQCREQIGLTFSDVEKKIKKISAIEEGDLKPTFNQLDTLSELYNVPRWVFISDSLPDQYQFNKSVPAFRQFANDPRELFDDHKVRSLVARVERLRDLVLELRDDAGESIEEFSPPELENDTNPLVAAEMVRGWLGVNGSFNFPAWKEKLEQKNIFVFMTSKYKGWSYVDKSFLRGLAIYHRTLPIIIINDSDAKKAQSFSLFHELGHLLRKESAIDDWDDRNHQIEKWCDELAGNILMPKDQIYPEGQNIHDLNSVKQVAKIFEVSAYSCLVRLRQLEIIDYPTYAEYEKQLKDEYEKLQKILRESSGGPARNRPQEVLNQYGNIYTKALFQAYNNKEIGLTKLGHALDLKRTSYILEVGERM